MKEKINIFGERAVGNNFKTRAARCKEKSMDRMMKHDA